MSSSKLHKEHRIRMKKRFRQEGLDSFSDHEVLEFLLFFGLPYKNTNEIAHHLMNRFGSLSGVLEAEFADLVKEIGIGENSAILMNFIPELFRRYSVDKQTNGRGFKDIDAIGEYLVNHYIGTTRERVELLLFDAGMNLDAQLTLSEGTFENSMLDASRIAEIMFSHHSTNFLLAHNHPSGDIQPSDSDLIITREIYKAFLPFKKYMLGHVIVAGGRYSDILPLSLSSAFCEEATQ